MPGRSYAESMDTRTRARTIIPGALQLSFADTDDVTDAWAVFATEPAASE